MGRERRKAAGIAAAAALLAACATPSSREAPGERLDETTGTTVTILPQPIELLAVAPLARGGDPFAYLAPFETNRMGARTPYLWVSVPGGGAVTARVFADGRELGMSAEPLDCTALGLSRPPYESPVPWNTQLCFVLAPGAIAILAGARELTLALGEGTAGAGRYAASGAALGDRLAEFAARTAGD